LLFKPPQREGSCNKKKKAVVSFFLFRNEPGSHPKNIGRKQRIKFQTKKEKLPLLKTVREVQSK